MQSPGTAEAPDAVDRATSKWMKLLSSTFLGDGPRNSSLSARHPAGRSEEDWTRVSHAALGHWAQLRAANGCHAPPALKLALVGGSAVVRLYVYKYTYIGIRLCVYARMYTPVCIHIGIPIHDNC